MTKMPGEISSGIINKPDFLFVWGSPGVGKSKFASNFPEPYFLDLEKGTYHLNVKRNTGLKTYQDVMDMLKWLQTEQHDYKTIAIDTIDSFEPMIFEAVCELDGATSIDKAQGGFGRGQVKAVEYMKKFVASLGVLRDKKNMNVIILGHSQIKLFNDPTLQPYDRLIPKLNEKVAAVIVEACDAVLYATYETTVKTERDAKKTRAFSDGERVLNTTYHPGFIAKNRYDLPDVLRLSFEAFKNAASIRFDPRDAETIKKDCLLLVEKVAEKDLQEKALKFIDESGIDLAKLRIAENRLKSLVVV